MTFGPAEHGTKGGPLRAFLAPAAPEPLGILRVGIALLALAQVAILWAHIPQLYGNFGFVQWAVLETEPDAWTPSIGKLALLLERWGVESGACVRGVFAVYAAALLGLLAGWRTRVWAVVAWAAHTLSVNSGYVALYGVDTMLHVCLFYFVWMPVGRACSLDRRRRPELGRPSFAAALSLRVLQGHLCLIYLNTGLAKAAGTQWWSGEALWRALMQPQFSVFDYSWLAEWPGVVLAACWGVVVLECGYAALMWPRATRRWWLGGVVLMHVGIGAMMGLWLFSTTMIVMNLCAWWPGGAGREQAPSDAPEPGPGPQERYRLRRERDGEPGSRNPDLRKASGQASVSSFWSSRRRILPVALRGRASRARTSRGTL